MLGDGCACLASAFLGGPPETTYSEVTGAMSITKITSPAVIRISAATAICFSVVGKLSALLQSIPQAVLGGIPEYIWFYPRILFFWCALFGMAIAASGDNRTGQPADPAREPLDKP